MNSLRAPLNPITVARSTGQIGKGLSGFLPPLPPDLVGNAIGGIVDNFKSLLGNLFGGGNRDVHIPAQQEAEATFILIADQVQQLSDTGTLTGQDLSIAITGMRIAIADFTTFVNACVQEDRCHRERALRGLTEITTLGNQFIRDWENAIRQYFPDTQLPPVTTGGTPPWGGAGPGGINYTTLALIGVGAWLLIK